MTIMAVVDARRCWSLLASALRACVRFAGVGRGVGYLFSIMCKNEPSSLSALIFDCRNVILIWNDRRSPPAALLVTLSDTLHRPANIEPRLTQITAFMVVRECFFVLTLRRACLDLYTLSRARFVGLVPTFLPRAFHTSRSSSARVDGNERDGGTARFVGCCGSETNQRRESEREKTRRSVAKASKSSPVRHTAMNIGYRPQHDFLERIIIDTRCCVVVLDHRLKNAITSNMVSSITGGGSIQRV
jgi:hypothetical protein